MLASLAVLVVADELTTRHRLTTLLLRGGFQVRATATSDESTGAAEPDVVVMVANVDPVRLGDVACGRRCLWVDEHDLADQGTEIEDVADLAQAVLAVAPSGAKVRDRQPGYRVAQLGLLWPCAGAESRLGRGGQRWIGGRSAIAHEVA